MKRLLKYLFFGLGLFIFWAVLYTSSANSLGVLYRSSFSSQFNAGDSTDLPYPIKEDADNEYADPGDQSPLYLKNPSNIESKVEYDPETRSYVFTQKVGDFDYRAPSSMTFEEYQKYEMERSVRDYWRGKSRGTAATGAEGFMPSLSIRGETFDKIFGSNTINIKPQGYAELTFGYNYSKTENPTIPERLRSQSSFNFDEQIRVDVTGTIGDKFQMGINYNTKATFDFENKTKLAYTGDEDEIIQKIEGGNLSFPLQGTLITGSQNLFGIKTDLQFGKLTVSALFSQQKSESKTLTVAGGAQVSEYKISAGDYDDNRHFFLGHYFYNNYDTALSSLQRVRSSAKIKNIEVWVTNTRNDVNDRRNILAFVDLAETSTDDLQNPGQVGITSLGNNISPDNKYNTLYRDFILKYKDIDSAMTEGLRADLNRFESGVDYVYLENARKLDDREYSINYDLGYISLTQALKNDEILAVAYEYEVPGEPELKKVGILSKDKPGSNSILMVKLIKGTKLVPGLANWDLMMKNIYSIGAFQVNNKDFRMDVNYQDDRSGTAIPYIPYNTGFVPKADDILISVMGLDQLNSQQDPYPDGVFDFVEGVTINSSNGRIIFPSVKPFGSQLKAYLINKGLTEQQASEYTYEELYTNTKTAALQLAEKNKYFLSGQYKSAFSSEIQLNAMNIPKGSVKIIAGGRQLVEGQDYNVDYSLGRVRILNDAIIQSGTPLQITLESQSLFNVQTKTLWGTHLNYQFNDKFYIGGTILNLTEKPLTKKVNFGDEPVSNTIWGLNTSYASKSPFITKMVNAIPLIETNKESRIRIDAEFAQLIPGSPKSVGKNGVAYIDDFEGSESSYSLIESYDWRLASTPASFPEGKLMNNLTYGFNRAMMSWYRIDNTFYNGSSDQRVSKVGQSSHYTREILQQEIFPNIDAPTGIPPKIYSLDLAFYPNQRGPYNFDVHGAPGISAGINEDGTLADPASRWGGIMREVPFKDFEESNVEFIEFWVLDPYLEDLQNGITRNDPDPAIYFNLGDVSEDILKDDKKSFENGLPQPDITTNTNTITTAWGKISSLTQITNSFDNNTNHAYQDVGYDGLSDTSELVFFNNQYLSQLLDTFGSSSGAYLNALEDPSNDNYRYYRDNYYDGQNYGRSELLERYKRYTNVDGNSPEATSGISQQYSGMPDKEDIDGDYTMSTDENYYEYKISMRPEDINEVGRNYINDIVNTGPLTFPDGTRDTAGARWIQFRVPVKEFTSTYGRISGFSSIRFVRMYLKGFNDSVVMRFARLELVRNEWRKYDLPLYEQGGGTNGQQGNALFEMESVNIEENADKQPVNYVLPPGFDREIDPSNPQLQQLNEQSMVLRVTDLGNGDARAVYKNMNLDMRRYAKLQMEVHSEAFKGMETDFQDGDLSLFVRIGSDYTSNYYEYEVPLKTTPEGRYNDGNAYIVWPDENQVDIDFDRLIEAKKARDVEMNSDNPYVTATTVYKYQMEDRAIYVKGYPNLANVKTFMIGIRNSSRGNYLKPVDDGGVKSGEIWVNELRLTDFKDKSGWAINARMQADLADLGSVTLSGMHSTPGFGSIEESVSNRALDETTQYGISTNLELGKFFPEKSGITIPAYVEYSKNIVIPEYDPLDPDVKLKDKLAIIEDEAAKQEYKKKTIEYTERQMVNFTNVKVNKSTKSTGKKYYPWDISNFSLNYNYNAEKYSDVKTEYDNEFNYKAGFFYNYSARPKNVSPFSKTKSKVLKSKYLKLVKDFNFYFLPSRFTFRTDLNRIYQETKLRQIRLNSSIPVYDMPISIYKDYTWNRQYDLKFDITKSLKFDFSAVGISRFDETNTSLDSKGFLGFGSVDWNDELYNDNDYLEKNWYGRITGYNHKLSITYQVPISKIPFFDWTDLNTSYSATYDWAAGPILADPSIGNLGNTVKNSNNISFNGQLRLTTLYNKVGYLKQLNQKYSGTKNSSNKKKEYKTLTYEKTDLNFYPNIPKSIIHKLKTEDVEVKVYDASGKEMKVKVDVISENKVRVSSDSTIKNAKLVVEGKVEKKTNPLVFITEQSVRILTGFKSISGTYTYSGGTMILGYTQNSGMLGLTFDKNGSLAPGIPFILGWQDINYVEKVAGGDKNLWLTQVQDQVNYYMMANTKSWNFRASYEPFKGFKIDLNSNWTKSETKSSNYLYDESSTDHPYSFSSALITGNYSMTTITLLTSMEKIKEDNGYYSAAYNQFLNNREIIAWRLADSRASVDPGYNPYENTTQQIYNDGMVIDTIQYTRDGNYPSGYGSSSQEVLLHSFYAAYTGSNANTMPLDVFQKIPLPNWRITFNGLSNIAFVKRFAKTIVLEHAYRSIYSIGSYSTNITNADLNGDGDLEPVRDLTGNFLNSIDANNVSISEQYSPLIGINITWKNDITTSFEMKNQRTLSLGFSNNQLTEMNTTEYVVGLGYRIKDFDLGIRGGNGTKNYTSDLVLRGDVTFGDNITIIRPFSNVSGNTINPQPSSGQNSYSIKVSADYQLSDSFTIRIFYDRDYNKPIASTSYARTTSNFGFSLRFTLIP